MKPIEKYALCAVKLQVLVTRGESDGADAASLRDEMDSHWKSLSKMDAALMRHLSVDLERAAKPHPTRASPPEHPETFHAYYKQRSWPDMLEALRAIPDEALTEHKRLTMMGRLWDAAVGEWLGDLFRGAAMRVMEADRRAIQVHEDNLRALRHGMAAGREGNQAAFLTALDVVGIQYTIIDGETYIRDHDDLRILTPVGFYGAQCFHQDELPEVLLRLNMRKIWKDS